jgi:hypothetical protein
MISRRTEAMGNICKICVVIPTLLCAACSSSSHGGGDAGGATLTGDAAVAEACGYLQTPAGNAADTPTCPVAPGGICLPTSGCDPASLPTGLSCTGQYCKASIDPCVPLSENEHIDFYACSCVSGQWACGLCGAGASTCAEAGANDATAADAGVDGSGED